MSDTIWLYWEGYEPAYISLCCKTAFTHNSNVKMLDRASFDHLFTEDQDINIDALSLNHKSDFIRAYLLKHYGGLYIDADCVVMQSLESVLDLMRLHGFVGYREPQGHMSCNFMASVPGGDVISDHYERVCSALRSRNSFEWLDLSSVLLNEAVSRYPLAVFLLPTDAIMPVNWSDSSHFCVRRTDEEHEQYFRPDSLCYMLSNYTIQRKDQTRFLARLPEEELLNQSYFLSFLFRKSLWGGRSHL